MSIRNLKLFNFNNRMWIKVSVVIIISFVLAVFLFNSYETDKLTEFASLDEFTAYLDERIPALMKDYEIPGVNIALVQKGKTTWSNAYGYADLEEGRKMTTDTYCRVESISKSVTAWGVMKLVEQGKIELDNPVKDYFKNWAFPESEFSVEQVTVRRLLSHSAGMPLGDFLERYSPKEDMPSLQESLAKEAILIQEPGISFSYSNKGFHLLELLIEEVTGRDFAEYMEEEVLIPLGMQRSSFAWSDQLDPGVPVGYDLKGNPIPVYVYPAKASGGLLANVGDIAAFVAAGMTNYNYPDHKVLTSQTISSLYMPMVEKPGIYGLAFDSYGLGHFLETLADGKQAVSHGGQGGGWMTHFHSVPETGDGIVILANSQRTWPFIAYILSYWAQWCGFSPVGMSRIIVGEKVLRTLIGLIFICVLWQLWRLGQGVIAGRRHFAPLSGKSRLFRLVQTGLSVILLSSLIWSFNQEYLFISSVFPTISFWLGFSLAAGAVVMLLSASLIES